jgi:hypothetical protein
MRTRLVISMMLVLSALTVKGELTVKQYKERMASSEALNVGAYIMGLGEGIGWANAAAGSKAPLYCQPPKLGIGAETFLNIIDRKIEALSKTMTAEQLDKTFIGLLLMKGLRETFPCESK